MRRKGRKKPIKIKTKGQRLFKKTGKISVKKGRGKVLNTKSKRKIRVVRRKYNQQAYNRAYDIGFDEAYNEGYDDGYKEGMEKGQQEGYQSEQMVEQEEAHMGA